MKDDFKLDNDMMSIRLGGDESGSVSTDSRSLISQLRGLRNSLYENYLPQSIQNLKYSAQVVMIVLIAMTIASYLFSQ